MDTAGCQINSLPRGRLERLLQRGWLVPAVIGVRTMIHTVRLSLILMLALASFTFAACGANASITTTSLPNGVVGMAYSAQLEGSNVASWSIASGSLPDGLSLSSGGAITGTPTTAGTSSFTIQAATEMSSTAPSTSRSLSITITES